jgi:predicted metal-binding membrane protein
MLYDPRGFGRLRNRVLLVSAIAWVWLFAGAQFSSGMESSVVAASEPHSHHASSASLLKMNLPASRAIEWLLMLAAMMAPTLITPLWYIRVRNFARRRLRSSALFVFGYAAVWMTVGALVLAAETGLKLLHVQSFWPAATLAMIALVWQTSPAKQRCLNRCHKHGSFAAFGSSADVDALRFGISHGVWCVGSCWALMVFPMLLPWGHVAAMAAVSILVFSERLERPTPPGWRFRGLGKATRIVLAQTARICKRLPTLC